MDIQKIIENVITVIMDCLEECFKTITIASGRRLLEVFFVCLGFLTSSCITLLLELPVFITWQESAVACSIVLLFLSIEFVNKTKIEKVKTKLKTFKEGGKQNGK